MNGFEHRFDAAPLPGSLFDKDRLHSSRARGQNDVANVEVRQSDFSLGKAAYDVQAPIVVRDSHVGNYHEGLDAQWFEQHFTERRAEVAGGWAFVMSGILLLVFAGGVSIYYIGSRSIALRQKVDLIQLHREAELGQLAGGLAHEIRNPLYAIRLNLQSLAKAYGTHRLSNAEVSTIVTESNAEIDRVNRLLTELLGYARPAEGKLERFDLRNEIGSTLEFLQPELKHRRVDVRFQRPPASVPVSTDRARMRQILLNLLMDAQEACTAGGSVELQLQSSSGEATLEINDGGVGISEENVERNFEPFFSTTEQGSGLRLPLVQRFVQEAGAAQRVISFQWQRRGDSRRH